MGIDSSRRLTRRAFLDASVKASLAVGGGLGAASLLAACGSVPAAAKPTPPPGSRVIRALLFDQVGYDPALLQKLADQFRTLHADKIFVSIETAHYRDLYESILAAGLTTPAPYDVVAVDQVWVPELASHRQLLPLAPHLDDAARADLMPSLLDAFSYAGAPYAMPQVLNVQSLYLNSAQLKAAGFAAGPRTLEEWHAQMTALRARQVPYTDSWAEGEGLVSDFVRLAAQFGGDLFDVKGHARLLDPPAQQAASFVRQLIDEHLVRPDVGATNEPDAMRSFVTGQVLYTTNWNFVFGAMNDPLYSRIIGQGAVAPIPASASVGKPAASVSGFLGLAVPSNSQDPELAFQWLRYLVSPEVQAQQLTQLPIWTSLQTSAAFRKANPAIDTFLLNLANARPRPQLTHYVEASAVLQHHLHDLVIGSASPSQAMSGAQSELTALEARWQS
ncbi:MAG TPA: extracellular solute-binding protein [Candidatus Limnocylindrales bacterium]|nr:extracellular solute-binding protein [Candidatus Limnocylindrales bacterium]